MKYLVIGSAGYIVDWYKVNGKKYLEAGYELVAINNAWSIDPDSLTYWVHSTDYLSVAKNKPDIKTRAKLKKVEFTSVPYKGKFKYAYKKQGSGCMILNTLTNLINKAVNEKVLIEVCLAGCDAIYKKAGQDHFYKGGTPDPVRFGEQYLKTGFKEIQGFYDAEGCQIYNVGGQEETLLPYARKSL